MILLAWVCVGWLLNQLKTQATGLSGHLSLFWPDVNQSVWIGGQHDPGLNERTPYWLNGFVPLAYQLQDKSLLDQVLYGSCIRYCMVVVSGIVW